MKRILIFLFSFCLQPLRPQLPRNIVSSAKLNLNRYWHKFEEMLNPLPATAPSTVENTSSYGFSSKTLRLLPPIGNGSLLRRSKRGGGVGPIRKSSSKDTLKTTTNDKIHSFIEKSYNFEKSIDHESSMYKHFKDDFLYHDVNLNTPSPPQSSSPSKCSCRMKLSFDADDNSYETTQMKYPFHHRNLHILFDDMEQQLLSENEFEFLV